MLDIARWMRSSPVITITGENGQVLGGAPCDAAPRERRVPRITRLFDDLPGVSRVSKGKLRLQRERIDLRAVLRNAVETLAPEFSERRQQMTVQCGCKPIRCACSRYS